MYFLIIIIYFKRCWWCSNQREEDLRENHPLFDTPLLLVPRESRFRKVCRAVVDARYDARLRDPVTGNERKVHYKSFQ